MKKKKKIVVVVIILILIIFTLGFYILQQYECYKGTIVNIYNDYIIIEESKERETTEEQYFQQYIFSIKDYYGHKIEDSHFKVGDILYVIIKKEIKFTDTIGNGYIKPLHNIKFIGTL